MSKELEMKILGLKDMSAKELMEAYDRVHDLNHEKKSMGLGEESGIWEQACYKEILRRMSR